MRRNMPRRVERVDGQQKLARLLKRGCWRAIKPAQLGGIILAPTRAVEQQRRKVAFQYFGRVKWGKPAIACFLPQPIGNARLLPRGAPCPLGYRRQARALGHQPRNASRLVEPRAPRQAAVDDDANAINGQAGLGDVGRKNDFPALLRVTTNRQPLRRRVDLAMQFMHDYVFANCTQTVHGAVNFAHAGQENQNVAIFLGQCLPDRAHDIGFDCLFGATADISEIQRPSFAVALDHWRIAHQLRKSGTIQGCRHGKHTQIGPEGGLCLKRKRKAKVAVDAAFMDFVKQDRRNADKLRVGDDTVSKNALGHDQYAAIRALFAIQPCRVANPSPDDFAQPLRNAFCRHTRGKAAWGQQQNLAVAIGLIQQCRGDHRGLTRTWWRNQNGIG